MTSKHSIRSLTGDPAAAIADPATLVYNLNTVFDRESTSKSVSAVILERYSKHSDRKLIRDFIGGTLGYANVFCLPKEGTAQLTPEVDTPLTSCRGKLGHDNWLIECAANIEIPQQKLRDITIGNIGAAGC